MDTLVPFLSILAALALGAVSPGPSFVFVVRTSLAQSRRDGIAAARGMGVGGVIFAALALLGLQVALALCRAAARRRLLSALSRRSPVAWRRRANHCGGRHGPPRSRPTAVILPGTRDTAEQPQDRDRLWQHLRRAPAAGAARLGHRGPPAGGDAHRDRLVLHRRRRFFHGAATRYLLAQQTVDRPRGRHRHGRAWPAAGDRDSATGLRCIAASTLRCGSGKSLIAAACPSRNR